MVSTGIANAILSFEIMKDFSEIRDLTWMTTSN